ncbi:unnamed protein product [Owenia fusiformis]|uniref:Uncharacterized protein n=1 Tax=Owenia fusiformis TaxID=6347 RepID=A0A8J1TRJ9_OWEFU|nr:unnamed protein product [Owenia fusiformis]
MALMKTLVIAVTIALTYSSVIKHRTKRQSSGTTVWSCDFERTGWDNPSEASGCGDGFSGMTQSTDDNLQFFRTDQATPSGHTGPVSTDFGSFYMYVESSPPASQGNTVSILSPELPSGFKTFSFKYYSRGDGVQDGQVEVTALNADRETLVFDQPVTLDLTSGDSWKSIDDVSLPSGTRYVRITATLPTTDKYWSADYAFDNIQVKSSDPCITTPCLNGGTCISQDESYICDCDTAPGWIGANCDKEDTGGSGADIVFLLDTTASVGSSGFTRQKEFVKSVANNLDIGGKERIAVIRWGQDGEIMFKFNEFTTINTLRNAIDGISYLNDPSLATDVSSGLKAGKSLFADSNAGNRMSAPNALVLVADDVSKLNKGQEYATATELKADGVKIMVLTAETTDERQRLLVPMAARIASEPVESYHVSISSFNDLGGQVNFATTALNNVNDNCVNADCGEGVCVDLINTYKCTCPDTRYGVACEFNKNAVSRRTADIVFILDGSSGVADSRVGESNFGYMKLMVVRTIQDLREWFGDDIRFGVVSFNGEANADISLDRFSDVNSLVTAIHGLQFYGGSSNVQGALLKTRQEVFSQSGDRGGSANFAVLFSNGPGNVGDNGGNPRAEAELLRESGATLMSVGLGPDVDKDELLQISSYPNEDNFLYRDNFDYDTSVEAFIVSRVVDSENSCVGTPCQNGGQCIDLSVGFECNCPSGFGGAVCERSCNVAFDVVIGIDRSGSLGADFIKELNFARQVAEIFPYDQTHLGAFSFSGDMRRELSLNEGTSLSTVRSKIMQTSYSGGSTFLTNAVREFGNMFTSSQGDLNSRANKAILLTDGFAKDDRANLASAANQLRSNGAEVFVIGFTSEVKDDDINKSQIGNDIVADRTRGTVLRIIPRSQCMHSDKMHTYAKEDLALRRNFNIQ